MRANTGSSGAIIENVPLILVVAVGKADILELDTGAIAKYERLWIVSCVICDARLSPRDIHQRLQVSQCELHLAVDGADEIQRDAELK